MILLKSDCFAIHFKNVCVCHFIIHFFFRTFFLSEQDRMKSLMAEMERFSGVIAEVERLRPFMGELDNFRASLDELERFKSFMAERKS